MQHCPFCDHEQTPADRCGACGEWLGDTGVVQSPQPTGNTSVTPPLPPADPPAGAPLIDHQYTEMPSIWDAPPPPAQAIAPTPPSAATPEPTALPEPARYWTPPVEPMPEPVESAYPADHLFAAEAAVPDVSDEAFVGEGRRDDAVDWAGVAATGGVSGRAVAIAGSRRPRVPGAVYALFTTMLIGVIAVVILTQVNKDGGGSRGPAKPGAVADEPDESLVRQRADLRAQWDELAVVERNDMTAGLLDQGERQWASIDGHWDRRDWSSANVGLIEMALLVDSLAKVKREVDAIARQRSLADELAKAVATARGAAERTGAPKLAAKLWADGNKADAEAKAKFDEGRFADSRADWDIALTAFEQANSLAAAGVAAGQTRKRVADRLNQRFTREQFDRLGGVDWKDLVDILAKGDAAYKAAEYSEAMAGFEHAADRIEAAELEVQRELGVKFYAVKAGYIAASILLEHASGLYLDEAGRDTLADAYRDLGLSASFVATLPAPADDKLAYRTLAEVLVTGARAAIVDTRGPMAQKSYNIGFQLRIVQKLLGEEGDDTLPDTDRVEIAKSLVVVDREAKEAGYADEMAKIVDSVRQPLTGNPSASAIGGARTRWLELVGKLSRYDTAIGLVGQTQIAPATNPNK